MIFRKLETTNIYTDILIIGGGSAGFGAAATIARKSCFKVILVEKNGMLGGTSTAGGVNNWEPGVGGPGIHYELYERMKKIPLGVCLGSGKGGYNYVKEKSWCCTGIDGSITYEGTLRRSGMEVNEKTRVHFEPYALAETMEGILHETGKVSIMYSSLFISSEKETCSNRIKSVLVYNFEKDVYYNIYAKYYLDCSADIVLARAAGCAAAMGEEGRDEYGESCAPDNPTDKTNGVSLIFRIIDAGKPVEEKVPGWVYMTDAPEWHAANKNRCAFMTKYPNGDICVNLLPTAFGAEYNSMRYDDFIKMAKARSYVVWEYIKSISDELKQYRFGYFFNMPGVRETWRLKGKDVLTQNDLAAGFTAQRNRKEIIAFGDHPLDVHGSSAAKGAVKPVIGIPYGILYGSIITNEYGNLAVACRGSSFSHIAASSCRLSRTMMALGEAAGMATVLACDCKNDYYGINIKVLRERLGIPTFEEKMAKIWQL